MHIEENDYFSVIKGVPIRDEMETPFGNQTAVYEQPFVGLIFKALVIEHGLIAAEVIFPLEQAGSKVSLHTEGLELMTVSQKYIKALRDIE